MNFWSKLEDAAQFVGEELTGAYASGSVASLATPWMQFEPRMIRDPLKRSGEGAKILAEELGIALMKERFDLRVCTLPNGNRADEQAPPFCR